MFNGRCHPLQAFNSSSSALFLVTLHVVTSVTLVTTFALVRHLFPRQVGELRVILRSQGAVMYQDMPFKLSILSESL